MKAVLISGTFPTKPIGCVLVDCVKRFNDLFGVVTGVMELAIEYVTSVENCRLSSFRLCFY